jgi:iron complex outermembrane receptor protein
MRKGDRYAPALVLAIGCTATPQTAFAEAEHQNDLFELPLERLEQMVVTAEKRSQRLQDVPLSITAFSGTDLAVYDVHDTQSLQRVTPGLVFNNTGSSAQPYLRGVGTRFAFAGLEPSVATYLDDRYVARAQATMFELADVERIEVLRGPQGTMYGRNATGGAIRVVTRGVTDELSGSITGTLGNYGLRAASGTINVPLGNGFATRWTALVRKRDGYADNLDPDGIPELDDRDVGVLRGKLRWDLSDRVSSLLTVQYYEQDDNFGNDLVDLSPPGLNLGIADGGISGEQADQVATAIDSKIHDEESSVDLRFDVSLSGADLVSITTYHDFAQEANSDADGTSAAVLDAVRVPQDARAFSQELQLLSVAEGPWRWIAGAYFFDETADFEIVLDRNAELESQGDQRAETTAFAIFGQASYEVNPRWSVVVGARWSYEEKQVQVTASSIAPVTLAPVPFSDTDHWSELTPRLTLVRRIEPGMLYVSYARGFKSGGYNYAASVNGGRPIDPEVLDMVELGWKTAVLDDRLQFNGSVFYYDYRNLQVTRAVSGSGINITENAADAKALGLDLDFAWIASDRLSLTAGLSLLDSEYRRYDALATVFNAALTGDPSVPGMSPVFFDARGEPLLRAPELSLFVSAEARMPIGAFTVPLVISYAYKDDYRFDLIADPTSKRLAQHGYGLLSARATLTAPDERWSLSLWGSNLTNEDDYFTDIVANSAGIRGSHGAPRTWGIDLGYRF